MKKIELIESLADKYKAVDPQIIAFHIGRAYNEILYATYRKNMNNIDIHVKTYDDVEVSYNEDKDQYYSELPVSVMQLPIAGDGVLSVHSKKSHSIEFYPKSKNQDMLHKGMEVDSVLGPIGYWLNGGSKIEYSDKIKIYKTKEVSMRLLPEFSSLEMTDEVHIPTGKDNLFFQTVDSFISGTPLPKEVNDTNTKTP